MFARRPSWAGRLAIAVILLLSLLSSAAFVPGARAAVTTVAVNTSADSTDPGCVATGTGTCSLRDALAYANANSNAGMLITITVPAGAYVLSDSSNTPFTVTTGANVAIVGAGTTATILDGASVNSPTGTGNFPRVVAIDAGATASLSGLTIRNGGNTTTVAGGGVLNNGTLTLDAVLVTQNGTSGGGGGPFGIGNGCGGGIANMGVLTLSGSAVVGNAAPAGGGICNADPGEVTLTGSTVSGNVAYFGGGIFNTSAAGTALSTVRAADANVAVTLRDSVITGNTASTEILFVLISNGNLAGGLGGGILTATGLVAIDRSTISANTAAGVALNTAAPAGGRLASLGGGIYSATVNPSSSPPPSPAPGAPRDGGPGSSVIAVTNSTISGNTATAGGAVYQHSAGPATLTDTTVAGNTTGLAASTADGSAPITVTRSIVANSRAGANCESVAPGGVVDGGFSLDSGATCGFAIANTDPQLGPLANNGGSTPTQALQPGSPAIDAAGAACAATDQRGTTRPQGAACDIGAFEYVAPAPQIGVSPTALDFGGQEVGTTSAAKQIAVANYGAAPLAIASVAIGGPNAADFAISGNTCGASVAAGTGCVISVTFKPTAQAAESATLTITDNTGNVAGSTQTVTLTGTGTIAVSYTVTVSVVGNGTVSPAPGTYSYQAGRVIDHTATPANASTVFIGWSVDGQFVGFANPLSLPVTKNRTVVATFAPRPSFTDVPTGQANYEAITQLAARGIIRGNGDGTYGPNAQVLRAQSAGLIARTFGWNAENHGNPFPDQCDANGQNCIDNDLWNSVGSLAFYNVARGYPDKTYQPRNPVLNAQVISFITRGFVAKGYWVEATTENTAIYPNVPQESGHRLDLITYARYAGAVPGLPTSGPFTGYDQSALRGFYAQALWQAYNAYFGTNRIP